LFSPDADPLVYYRAILDKYLPRMKTGGYMLLEAHAPLAAAYATLLDRYVPNAWQWIEDLHGRKRIIMISAKSQS
jgi:hypothetical protein